MLKKLFNSIFFNAEEKTIFQHIEPSLGEIAEKSGNRSKHKLLRLFLIIYLIKKTDLVNEELESIKAMENIGKSFTNTMEKSGDIVNAIMSMENSFKGILSAVDGFNLGIKEVTNVSDTAKTNIKNLKDTNILVSQSFENIEKLSTLFTILLMRYKL